MKRQWIISDDNHYTEGAEYGMWIGLLVKCRSMLHRGDPEYRVCDRWQSWFNFIADVGAQPTPEHVIGRIDKTHGFETGNCCWAITATSMASAIFTRTP